MIHTAVKGDTLWSIAKQYGTTVENLVKLNNFKDPHWIYPGDRVVIREEVVTIPDVVINETESWLTRLNNAFRNFLSKL